MDESSSLWESNCNSKGLMRESNSRYNNNSSIINMNSGNGLNISSSTISHNVIPYNNNNIPKHNNTTKNNIQPC